MSRFCDLVVLILWIGTLALVRMETVCGYTFRPGTVDAAISICIAASISLLVFVEDDKLQ